MRAAKAADHWRHLHKNPPTSPRLHRIRVSNADMLGNADLDFSGSIVGVCGANGVGKSTLLSILYHALSDGKAASITQSQVMRGYKVEEIDFDLGTHRINDVGSLKDSITTGSLFAHWVDGALLASMIRHLVERDQNFSDFLEQSDPKIYDENDLDEISYLVGKRYSRCYLYEIDEYGDYQTFPYFEVESGGIIYRSEHMGRGELSALILYWSIMRAEGCSVLLLEEPEAHLPVRSQLALMNILAREVVTKRIFAIVVSHSSAILGKLKREDLRLVSRVGCDTKVSKDIAVPLLNDMFGVARSIRAILVVEDQAARYFTHALIDAYCADRFDAFEIAVAGSDGEVLKALRNFPKVGVSYLRVIGVLDGDQRRGLEVKSRSATWPMLCLPGDVAPELLFKVQLSEKLELLSRELNVTMDRLHGAIGYLEGEDHHDWLSNLAFFLDVSYEDCCVALTNCWLHDDASREASERFMEELTRLSGISR